MLFGERQFLIFGKEKQENLSKRDGPESLKESEKEKKRLAEENIAVEKALAEASKIDLSEKAEEIKNFIESAGKMRKSLQSLLELTPQELEKALGNQKMDLIYADISAAKSMRAEVARNGLNEKEIKDFTDGKSPLFLPERIRCALTRTDRSFEISFIVLSESALDKERAIKSLRNNLFLLKEELGEWQKYYKVAEKEKAMEIEGFESFNFPNITGNELVKMAAEILPHGINSTNVRRIKYKNTTYPINEAEYGFKGESFSTFFNEDREIVFHKLTKTNDFDYMEELPFILAHEWGHGLDPRLIEQKNLMPGEQFHLVKEWEQVRSKEKEMSSYVKEIKNPNKQTEKYMKSRESFAEGIAYFISNPQTLRHLSPKRYDFFNKLIRRIFPEFDPQKQLQARKFYRETLRVGFSEEK